MNNKIYEVGIHWSYYSEYSDNCGDFAQRFFSSKSKAEIYFDELKERIRKGIYNRSNTGAEYIYIKKYELNVDNECPTIKTSKI